jgi:hypothetical protein
VSVNSTHAHEAAHAAANADDLKEATANGLAAVTFALLDVAEAIREASKSADDEPKVKGSRDW